MRHVGQSMQRPLGDVTVLDLSRVLSGPYATMQLVDLGARVIKLEHPGTGDDTRSFGPPFVQGESTYFMSVNRAKQSVAIDLKKLRGKQIAIELARGADVVIENFRPGTAQRLGLGLRSLRELEPKLVTCSISGYGGAGGDPRYDTRPGYDSIAQAVGGLMSVTGDPDGPPVKVGVAIADLVAGLFAVQGILAALYERARTGVGQHVDVSMQDAVLSLMTYQAGICFATGAPPPRMGDAHPSICPYETVITKDGRFVLAVGNDAQFGRLVELLDMKALTEDPRFSTNAARVQNRPALLALIAPKIAERSSAAWDHDLQARGIPGAPVLDMAQALSHPQALARGSVLTHEHPIAGAVRSVASPVRFDGARPSPLPAPPLLGEHTSAVLTERIGLDAAEITRLVDEGVLYAPPPAD